MPSFSLPEFQPYFLLRGGHVQTLAAYFWPGKREYNATKHRVTLDDGDVVVLHDDRPDNWTDGDRVALLMPGLAGCHMSGYLARTAAKLTLHGVRVFRMDHRGWGSGAGLAEHPFHAGRSGDVLTAVRWIAELCPGSPITAVGFSLSGNVVLKMLGEFASELPPNVNRAAALTPPIDLAACASWMERPGNRFYNRHMVNCLLKHLKDNGRELPTLIAKTLREFDDRYTAHAGGFESVADYYHQSSANQFLDRVPIPTFIVAATDDPMIPIASFKNLPNNPALHLHVASSGGHLGFVGQQNGDPDRRWLDWRIVDWVLS